MTTTTHMMHWNYFFAIEDDLATLSRHIEFHKDNFQTYSVETAVMDTRSAAVDLRSRRSRPGASPQKPSAALPNVAFPSTRTAGPTRS
jgi:hypothetical protein